MPGRKGEVSCWGDGLAPVLDGVGETPSWEVALEPVPEFGLLAAASGVKEIPDCRMSSSLMRISD